MSALVINFAIGIIISWLVGRVGFEKPVAICLSLTFGLSAVIAFCLLLDINLQDRYIFACAFVVAIPFVFIQRKRPFDFFVFIFTKQPETSHGTAQWADKQSAKRHDEGFPLGRLGKFIFRIKSHLTICAPTRSGKGTGLIIPTLLEHVGSIICLDVKGENYAVTHRQRENLGNRVYLLDPFGLTSGRKTRFNWLDTVDIKNPDCIGQSAAIADMIVAHDTAPKDPHFEESAKALIQGLILLAAADPIKSERNIVTVRKILTLPDYEFMALMKEVGS